MAGNDGNPFLGVPQGSVRVENPDGVFVGSTHNLYDKPLVLPVIPGDFDLDCNVPMEKGGGYR